MLEDERKQQPKVKVAVKDRPEHYNRFEPEMSNGQLAMASAMALAFVIGVVYMVLRFSV